MVLVGGGIVLVLLAVLALLPNDRLPPWVTVYIGVAIAAVIVVIVVAVLT